MAHKLKLFVRDILDARYLPVSDLSLYDEAIPVENLALFVQLPGFDDAVSVPMVRESTIGLTGDSLQICPDEELQVLPDGLYTLTLSVAPNDEVHTVVYHYRTAQLLNRVYHEVAKTITHGDKHTINGFGEIDLNTKEESLLRCLLLLAALKASLCNGVDMVAAENSYNEISKILDSFNCH
jgi:hypothetical protein